MTPSLENRGSIEIFEGQLDLTPSGEIAGEKNNGQTRPKIPYKVKVGVLRPVQQPGSYWDRSSELPLVGLEPTEVTAYD